MKKITHIDAKTIGEAVSALGAGKAVIAGGTHARAVLEIDWRPTRQHCESCGVVARRPGSWLLLCPSCSGPLHLEGGDELDLLQLLIDVPSPSPDQVSP